MIYLIFQFFYTEDNRNYWLEKVKESPGFNLTIWDKVGQFLSAAKQIHSLKIKLIRAVIETNSLEEFLQVAADEGYHITQEELAWFVMTKQQIWQLLSQAQQNSCLKMQLLSVKTPQEFISQVAENGYHFSIEEFGWFLTDIKMLGTTTNMTGNRLFIPCISKISTADWLSLGEDLGIVPPFCNLGSKLEGGIFQDYDISDPNYFLEQCFLPRGYFEKRLNRYA
ncbi:MAG: Nif11-like leader peptide family natural product precursor [Nostocaceae cyanobacterium]|nr:Nif11-like leader peptide family natural product precursor [Nostocaceae cyanobacterium]